MAIELEPQVSKLTDSRRLQVAKLAMKRCSSLTYQEANVLADEAVRMQDRLPTTRQSKRLHEIDQVFGQG